MWQYYKTTLGKRRIHLILLKHTYFRLLANFLKSCQNESTPLPLIMALSESQQIVNLSCGRTVSGLQKLQVLTESCVV